MLSGKKVVVSFVDFKNTFDLEETLYRIIMELGVKTKLATIIKEILMGTTYMVKFIRELSQPFEIRTGVKHDITATTEVIVS